MYFFRRAVTFYRENFYRESNVIGYCAFLVEIVGFLAVCFFLVVIFIDGKVEK